MRLQLTWVEPFAALIPGGRSKAVSSPVLDHPAFLLHDVQA
jgi:hypothetical protein